MIPKSFSATALNVAELCLARYKAESIDRGTGIGNSAASTGTSVHGALEMYVKAVYINKTHEPDLKFLLDLFKMSYMTTFGTADLETQDFEDGVEMLTKWFHRTNFENSTVISAEVKTSFPIKTSLGEIPFNYIWDRFDQIGKDEYKVVDYKTNRWGINPTDLKKKIQARAYGVAAQIAYPNAKRIWVEFDMLRHDGPVGIVFTRDDNIATWRFMVAKAQQIIDTPDDEVTESLNGECLFCVRKQSCKALLSNIAVGGVFSIQTPADMVDQRAALDFQKKAVESALKELDVQILATAKEADEWEFESDTNRMNISVYRQRAVDPEMAQMALPEDIFKKYGGSSFTIGNVDKLLKGNEIDDATKSQLRSLIYTKTGEPSVKSSAKSILEDD